MPFELKPNTDVTLPNGKTVRIDEDLWVTGEVKISLGHAVKMDLEGFLDHLADELVGDTLLMNVSYKPVRLEGETIVLEVTGDPSQCLDFRPEDGDAVGAPEI